MPKRKNTNHEADGPPESKKLRDGSVNRITRKDQPVVKSIYDLQRLVKFHPHNNFNSNSDLQECIDFVKVASEEVLESKISSQSRIVIDFAKKVTLETQQSNSSGLIETWIRATQTEDDDLFVLVLSFFAALVKLFASCVELESFGIRLCNTLPRHVKLLNYGCYKDSEHWKCVSSILLLLTNLVSFGDGICAQQIYAQELLAFKKLNTFLTLRNTLSCERATIRSVAMHFLVANLRFQKADIKIAILTQPRLTRVLFSAIREDEPNLVADLCQTLLRGLVMADEIPRHVKSHVFTEPTLASLLDLYKYSDTDNKSISLKAAEASHRLLISVCSRKNGGILLRQRGWHSLVEADHMKITSNNDGTTPTCIVFPTPAVARELPVKNLVLRALLQRLKPYKSERECELTIAIFKAAPELVSDYFMRKKSVPSDPELSAGWIGYNSFLCATIEAPIPEEYFDIARADGYPLPVAIILESILPCTMSHKTITKGINHRNRLIKAMSLKLLRASFLKLGKMIHFIKSRSQSWSMVLPALIEQFSQRCPDLKHLFSIFRKLPTNDRILREMVTGVIAMYFDHTPQLAVLDMVDLSTPLSDILESQETAHGQRGRLLDTWKLGNLNFVKIICFSPQIRWWHRPNGLGLSPFTSMLRLYVQNVSGGSRNIKALLQSILHNYSILQHSACNPSLAALVASLIDDGNRGMCFDTWSFVDECILRLIRKPAKYFGDLEDLTVRASSGVGSLESKVSLFAIVVAEQFPLFSSRQNSDPSSVQTWVQRYLSACQIVGEDSLTLGRIRKHLLAEGSNSKKWITSQDGLADRILQIQGSECNTDEYRDDVLITSTEPELWERSLEDTFRPPAEPTDHNALYRWEMKEICDAVQDSSVSELFICLSSSIEEIRRQAILKARLLVSKLKTSGCRESQQLLLLSGALLETVAEIEPSRTPPTIVTALAARSVSVLHDPLHALYSKINTWLQKGPAWNWRRIPAQWVELALFQEFEPSEKPWRDVDWVLDTLFDGLCSPMDMDLYFSCQVFERLFSFSFGPNCSRQLNDKILRLVFRATFVEGSATLIARCGVMGWIRYQLIGKSSNQAMLNCLRSRLFRTCGEVVSGVWSVDCRAPEPR